MIARPDHLTIRPNLARRWSKAQPILQIDDKTGSGDLPVGPFVDRRVESSLQKYFRSYALFGRKLHARLGRFASRGRERVTGDEMSTLVMPGQKREARLRAR